jgi:hypothetical protein
MKLKRPYVATLDQVRITSGEEEAIIEYREPDVSTTHLKLGPCVREMSDQQILDSFNETIVARDRARAQYEHVAIEIPPGKPQIEYFDKGEQWTPRGDVLRCVIHDDGSETGPMIEIDDHELTWEEFGRLIKTCSGWGMRVTFVPDDDLDHVPKTEVRDTREGER